MLIYSKKGKELRIIAVSNAAPAENVEKLEKKALVISTGTDKVDLTELARKLKEMGINTLMVEGGATLIWGMLSEGLVDEIYTFIGNVIIGGATAPTFTDGPGLRKLNSLNSNSSPNGKNREDGVLLKMEGKREKKCWFMNKCRP